MQLKGLIRLFTIALILISLFQLSFTFFVRNFEKKEKAKVESQLRKEFPNLDDNARNALSDDRLRLSLDSLSEKKVVKLGFTNYTYQEAKEQELNLGLDLQGGMNVVLEVSLDELVRNMSNNPADPGLRNAIAAASARKANSQADFISLFVDEYVKVNPNLASMFAQAGTEGKINFNSSNEEVVRALKAEAIDAIKRTHKVIETRVNRFGVANPNINLDENQGIISVELAGVNNPERIRRLLQATAKLEFWRTYHIADIAESFKTADENLKNYLAGTKPDVIDSLNGSKDSLSVAANAKDTGDNVSLSNLLKKDSSKKTTGAKDTSKKGKEAELAQFESDHPLIYFMGFNMPIADQKTGKPFHQSITGMIRRTDTAKLNYYLNLPVVKNSLPRDLKILFGPVGSETEAKDILYIYAIKKETGKDTPPLDGESVEDTRANFDPLGKPEVSMEMKPDGANKWRLLTKNNVGKQVAIVLDDVVYSAPNILGEIPNGRTSITGGFTIEEATDLANVLKTGKLAATTNIVQEQVVGPTLGEASINGGMWSFIISFIVIFALMLVYYNSAGWVANIALILNLLFTVGVLAALHASLTAAGIAGLVLTIGMAVDTNVIIFERIKEELKLGKTHSDAVNEGYRRSLSPVLDGHITVLMTAIILFIFGLGPVLGFATTQILGILLSLFCGILVSRLITDLRMSKGKHFNYFTGLSEKLFQKFHFHFIEWRKKAYVISIIVLIAGIASLFNGFDYGVEFAGGRSYTVQMPKSTKTEEVREALKPVFEEYPIVKTIGTKNQINITTSYKIKDPNKTIEQEVQSKLYEGLKAGGFITTNDVKTFKEKDIIYSQTVLPSISDDLKKGAYWATFWSLLLIAVYIFIRFRKWQYSVGTLVALVHDVLVTLAVFSFLRRVVPFSLEIDQHFIAAVLTVIGFSMNDTVIVFDRIREYFRKRPGDSKTNIINAAINDTLSRTIMTSLTVFLTLLILFIFGGEVTRGFAFAMMIGVITGTYSSIFVAAPILVDLDKNDKLTQEEDKDERIKALKELA
ncbi:MAG: protein translocase subunit SecDF [Chitinophagaceae bacterium]|nr:protein translocase subunit SecDF [Chitinophagaceae bacterium]